MDTRDFQGTIGRDWQESRPWWPPRPTPPAGAPNVVFVLLDDVGFAQIGCYGSDIRTPNLDALAAGGLQFTSFHTTALCSPTRACTLTGRNHHSNGMGRIIELATGYPGYSAQIPRRNGFLSEMLTPHGYAAYAVGKWHLTPEDECNLAAPRTRWPLGRGFERFYGFFSGETHQYSPALVQDNQFVDPPGSYETGYHLTEDLADTAIRYLTDLRAVAPDKPFFLYFTPGACHSPHQVHPEWMQPYRGHFDAGWDAWREATLARQVAAGILPAHTTLSERPEWVPAWEDLSDDERAVYARYMEAFAGMLTHTDAQIGRLVDFLRTTGDLDNTLIIVISDNGASSEGGPEGSLNDVRQWNGVPRTAAEAAVRIDEIGGPRIHNNYPWGWTVAGNTPFRRWKRETHEGGVADPMIVHWPAGIDEPGLRHQYTHAIDLVPTVLEAIGIDAPSVLNGVEQAPIEGTSFAYALNDPDAPERHVTQYYEMFGCRAIYHDGFKAVVYNQIMDWQTPSWDDDPWELYDLRDDPSETRDLAAEQPERLRAMVQRWWVEAARHNVLPLDNRPLSELVMERPSMAPERARYVYFPGGGMVPEAVAPNVRLRTHRIAAEITVADGETPSGALVATGSLLGGWSLWLADGSLHYAHNLSGFHTDRVSAPVALAPGDHELAMAFVKTGDLTGTATLQVDGEAVASVDIAHFTPVRFSLVAHGLTVGRDGVLAVVDDYTAPNEFTGTLRRVVITVDGPPHLDPEGEAQVAVVTQ